MTQCAAEGTEKYCTNLPYNIDQAADATGLSRSSLYEEIRDDALWTFRAKGRVLILREVLDAYIERQAAEARAAHAARIARAGMRSS
jgi:predicted DNA-binding transcriptional regulator AlpA